jgi:uncharacterized protein YndB with AHSA1/START domain
MKPLEVATPADTRIRVSRSFEAPRALVWRAFTEPDLVKRWLTGPPGHTMPECEIDLRVGGRWRYVWSTPEGMMSAWGAFVELVPERRMVHTETFDFCRDKESLVETELTDAGGGTLVVMTMNFDSLESRDTALRSGMADGMEASYVNLDALLEAVA